MPNITGTIGGDEFPIGSNTTGAFYKAGTQSDTIAGSGHPSVIIGINASRCSKIYGNSNTVQPPSLKTNIWIRIS